MIGLIVTGHGTFASGLTSSLQLICGHNALENYCFVNFEDHDTLDILEEKMITALNRLSNCSDVVILCDLMGGSPFKTSATLSMTNNKIKVVAGVNLGMLMEANLSRMNMKTDRLIQHIIDVAKTAIVEYVYQPYVEEINQEGI